MSTPSTDNITLSAAWEALKKEQPHIRIRNAAEALNVSEAELLATRCGNNVTRLTNEHRALLKEVKSLGKVMALTRNDSVVHERKGVYLNDSISPGPVGLFVNEDIDLRIFFSSWQSVFAVSEMARGKERHSLQFFAKNGEAVHKIYLVEDSSLEAYQTLVAKYKAPEQSKEELVTPSASPEAELPDADIDVANFQKDWLGLKDTHQFFGLLGKYKLKREQALRLAPEGNYAVPVAPVAALRATVTKAADTDTPIMVFVSNQGMIQIHTGPVKKLLDHEGWFNVMDPDFNLHVKEADIVSAWIVRKPSEDGVITALECFNKDGVQIVQLFGKRKPGIPELESWRTIIDQVQNENSL